jgi:hypothetical protein
MAKIIDLMDVMKRRMEATKATYHPGPSIEYDREALSVAKDWMVLPGNERAKFRRAIAKRAAFARDETIEYVEYVPAVVVRLVPIIDGQEGRRG